MLSIRKGVFVSLVGTVLQMAPFSGISDYEHAYCYSFSFRRQVLLDEFQQFVCFKNGALGQHVTFGTV